jgi:hypothetical protein
MLIPAVVIIGRLLIGYAVGTITGVAPVYGAEIAKVPDTNHCLSFTAMMLTRRTDP